MSNRTVVIDIGANEGDFGIGVARRNPEMRVLCIEPQPALASELKQKAESEASATSK